MVDIEGDHTASYGVGGNRMLYLHYIVMVAERCVRTKYCVRRMWNGISLTADNRGKLFAIRTVI